MTVFIRNQSDGDEFVKICGDLFKSVEPDSQWSRLPISHRTPV
jgi:hypothetical protein